MPTFRTLCSGGELFGLGACHAGWRHVDGYEIEDRIASVARLNGLDVRTADICAIDFDSLIPVDHLHASPSCKNASQASQGVETLEDRSVADAIGWAIEAHQGRSFSLENVWGYRTFESFQRILAALDRAGFAHEYRHLNSADYGVPQTRKRLILLAVQRDWRVRPRWPMQTHRRGGGLGVAPWAGWLSAIADLVDSLPATEPAPWQLARLPAELRASLLFHQGISRDHKGNEYQQHGRDGHEPAYTITSNGNQTGMRAYILSGENAGGNGEGWRVPVAPSFTVTSSNKGCTRAFLISDQSASAGSGVQIRYEDEPAVSVRAGQNGGAPPRASIAGRWVRMTVQALSRFQTVPDSYRGLTSEINGNGVPCLLAQRIMESLP